MSRAGPKTHRNTEYDDVYVTPDVSRQPSTVFGLRLTVEAHRHCRSFCEVSMRGRRIL